MKILPILAINLMRAYQPEQDERWKVQKRWLAHLGAFSILRSLLKEEKGR